MLKLRLHTFLFLAFIVGNNAPMAKTLLSAYQEAAAGSGYDKLVVLHSDIVYTGGLDIISGSVCIRGQGALILLDDTSAIRTEGFFSRLDIDHCVLKGGQFGLFYRDRAQGEVINNTFYANWDGIRCIDSCQVTIKNNIIVNHQNYGIYYARCGSGVTILYNDVWANSGGNYMRLSDCGCGDTSFTPAPGSGEISEDPLFADAAQNKFNLTETSPCIRAGENGIDMGALVFSAGVAGDAGIKPGTAAGLGLTNYPNPFTVRTTIGYQLPSKAGVCLKIYNIAGRLVKTLVNGPVEAGRHTRQWDGRDADGKQAAGGVYFCRLSVSPQSNNAGSAGGGGAGTVNATKRMILVN